MNSLFIPAAVFILGAFLIPLLKDKVKQVYMLLLPGLAYLVLTNIPEGVYPLMSILGQQMLVKVDKMSLVFAYVFLLITFIGVIYSLHVKDKTEHVAAFIYAGAALGIVLAGDFISLFVFWEVLTLSALFIIWSSGTEKSRGAGFRYAMVHLFGGLCLLAGIILRVIETGTIELGFIGLDGLASYLIFVGVIVNVAIPPLHAWLVDAYPEASITGTVFLSVFTTKSAVYVLARTFPGTELLVILGTCMALIPIFYAVLENDLRRVLSYSLINQVGFMVVGVGLGTSLAVNGAVAHAFADILFKGLLFMSVGAVMYRTGTAKVTELGGLYRTMPVTLILCLVGAASISAFPLTSAFVTKSMIITELGQKGYMITWFLLVFAAAGVLHHAGIKVPFSMFWAHDSGLRPKEAPLNMQIAMGIAAFFCIFIGVYPDFLYSMLPFPVDYVPYTFDHVLTQLLLLLFAVFACCFLIIVDYHPPEQNAIYLDSDWFYRKAGPKVAALLSVPFFKVSDWLENLVQVTIPNFFIWFGKNPLGALKIASDTLAVSLFDGRSAAKNRLKKEKEIYPRDLLKPMSLNAALSVVLMVLAVALFILYF